MISLLQVIAYMNNEMRNGWIDIISKMYKDLHNSERVLHVSKESDKKEKDYLIILIDQKKYIREYPRVKINLMKSYLKASITIYM